MRAARRPTLLASLTLAIALAVGFTALTAASAAAAAADPIKVMICYPGGPGSQEEAAPRLHKFFRRVESIAGWDEGRVKARYLNTEDACQLYLKEQRPQIAILSLGTFLELGESLKALPVMEILPVGGERDQYYVVVEQSDAKSLADLKGKTLTGEHLGDPRFLSRVVFAGAVDAAKDFALDPTRTSLRGIKQVHKGKADAVILDSRTFAELKTLPFGDALRAVFTSEPLPGWPLTALGDAKPGDRIARATRETLVDAMAKACDGEGREICDSVRLGGFQPLKGSPYAAVRKLYAGGDSK